MTTEAKSFPTAEVVSLLSLAFASEEQFPVFDSILNFMTHGKFKVFKSLALPTGPYLDFCLESIDRQYPELKKFPVIEYGDLGAFRAAVNAVYPPELPIEPLSAEVMARPIPSGDGRRWITDANLLENS